MHCVQIEGGGAKMPSWIILACIVHLECFFWVLGCGSYGNRSSCFDFGLVSCSCKFTQPDNHVSTLHVAGTGSCLRLHKSGKKCVVLLKLAEFKLCSVTQVALFPGRSHL